ncbi:MAG: Uma2 family endonuclease [Chloroflexota bacterium]
MLTNQNTFHQYVTGELFVAFRDWLNRNRSGRVVLGPVNVRLQENARLIQPDLFVALGPNWRGDVSVYRGVPDLVVEVLSDETYRIDRVVKYISYEQVGVKEYWIVNLKTQSVEVYSLTDKEYSFVGEYRPEENVKSPLLEGLSIPVRTLFPKVSQFTEKIKVSENVQYNGEVSPEAIGETVAA